MLSPSNTDLIEAASNEDENLPKVRSIQLNNSNIAGEGDGQDVLVTPIISCVSIQRIDMIAGAKLNRTKFQKKKVKSPSKLSQDIVISKYETKGFEKKSTDKIRNIILKT